MPAPELDFRCFCARRPLLAVCGRDTLTGEPFVWMKVHKQQRIFGEMIATAGTVRIRCRECLRWHTLTIKRETVDFVEESLPESLVV